jgi:hypothetical protein
MKIDGPLESLLKPLFVSLLSALAPPSFASRRQNTHTVFEFQPVEILTTVFYRVDTTLWAVDITVNYAFLNSKCMPK